MKAEDTKRNLQSKSETGYHSSISKIGRSLNDVGAERQAVFQTRRRGVPGIRHRSRGKRVRGGEKCRVRDPRKDVHREPEKGRVRDPVSVRVRIRTMAVSVLVICARVWGPRDGKLPCSRSWWHLHVLIILKTSK